MADPLFDTDTALEEQPTDTDKLREVHKRAMARFDECNLGTAEQRAWSLSARRFVTIPGAQWEGDWGEQFASTIMIEIDNVGRGLRKIENDYRENRIIPDFRPDGGKADQQTADMLDGLHRADSYRFKAAQARDNAFFEAASGGFGSYRLTNEWEDEGDKDNDCQRVNPAALIVDADQTVFFDMNARFYDKSDARFAFIRTAFTVDAYLDRFGEDRVTEFPDTRLWEWKTVDWFKPDTVAVAEYYEREEVSDTLWILTHSLSKEEKRLWSKEIEPGTLAGMDRDGWTKRSQNRKRWRVHKYILSGAEVIEDRGLIAGEHIPIVPVYGRRYYVEGVEWWQGYVQSKMNAQRLFNSNVSSLAEINSLAPREVPIFDPEQIDTTMAGQWSRANIDRLPYLTAHALRDADGNPTHLGPIGMVQPPQLSPVKATLLQISKAELSDDDGEGANEVKANTSAEAMDIAATRIDAKSGIYLDNMRQSVEREGVIYLSMAREVYCEPGRTVETMSEDGDDGSEILAQQVTDPDTGNNAVVNDLQSGRYKVIASVTEATATRRDKTVRSMLNIAQIAMQAGDNELGNAAILTAISNTDGEGMDEFQAFARQKGLSIGLFKPNEEEQQAMDQASQNAAPDPIAQVAEAQAADFAASAAKKQAEIPKIVADTALSKAKAIATMADAHTTTAALHAPDPERPLVRRGSDFAVPNALN